MFVFTGLLVGEDMYEDELVRLCGWLLVSVRLAYSYRLLLLVEGQVVGIRG